MLCLFGYVGPETIMPLGSAIAAIVGAIMLCGRTTFSSLRRLLRLEKPARANED